MMMSATKHLACKTRQKTKIERTELYKICNKHRLFTCGTARQYEKMFDIAQNGITQTELARILYICSFGKRLDEINDIIAPLFNGGVQ
jgi:hypothetical protein